MIVRRTRLAAPLAVLLLAAWDTHELADDASNRWFSMFVGPSDDFYTRAFADPDVLTGNEHAEISHYAFHLLGWSSLYAEPLPDVIDLNASIWHREVRDVGAPMGRDDGDDPATPLVERALPHPARFTGLPDFSYTVTDWINRNRYCPALPPGAPAYDACHEFSHWLGAVLNSSHFGDQATAFYRHFHAIALTRASAAGAMAVRVEAALAGGEPIDVDEARRFVREAELAALAYEAVGQHFLQDRWSSGHMWNRWNAPSYEGLPNPDAIVRNRVIGALSGVIHGAEAVVKGFLPDVAESLSPDPMCSPYVIAGAAVPVSYQDAGGRQPGIGDYRFADALRGTFGERYGLGALPLPPSTQMSSMMRCSTAGWADVARRFGANADGTRGTFGLAVANAPGFDDAVAVATGAGASSVCFDHWATNFAFDVGLSTIGQGLFGTVLGAAAQVGAIVIAARDRSGVTDLITGDFVDLVLTVKLRSSIDADGTDLARGVTLPPIYGASPGQAYLGHAPPAYAEPVDVEALPLLATEHEPDAGGRFRPGRDRRTLFGFFNHAHAPELCRRADLDLAYDPAIPLDSARQGLRWPVPLPAAPLADELARRRDACVYLADRLFERTYAWYLPAPAPYEGAQAEERRRGSGPASSPAARPMCHVLGATPARARSGAAGYWTDNPVELHPGYVSADLGPYATLPRAGRRHYASLDAWCRAVPVIHVDDDDMVVDQAGARQVITPGFDADDRVRFEPAVRDPQVTIRGVNFGAVTGRVKLVGETGCVDPIITSELADVVAWSDTAITFVLNHTRFPPDVYRIEIIRDDRDPNGNRVRSVGRARLDVRKAVFGDIASTPPPLPADVTGQPHAALHPFCAGGTVLRHTIDDCSDVIAGALPLCGADTPVPVGERLWSGPAPMASPAPGPYAEHQFRVTHAGLCAVIPAPLGCSSALPIQYGLVWRLERTSTAPVTSAPRPWRFTLAWSRAGAP